MAYLDFMTALHSRAERDYLARVNDIEFPKYKAAELAKKYSFDYWDGSRKINYGGYKYIPGRWEKVAIEMANHYDLGQKPKILDIGCGKGYLLYDFLKVIPDADVYGIDISEYAIDNCKPEIKDKLIVCNSNELPFEDDFFDLVISINVFHNLYNFDLAKSISEMERVGKNSKYICVESYRNEIEKANLIYWQVTCEAFNTPDEWQWWFNLMNYTGDYSFIYFE